MLKNIDWNDIDNAQKSLKLLANKMLNNMSVSELNYDELHNELYGYYNISIDDNLDTQQINDFLTYLQNTRSRVAYITMQALRLYKGKKSIIDILTPILIKNADNNLYKNKESREGFAIELLSPLLIDMQVAEFLKSNAEACLNNLNDLISTISRQISVLQIELQLGQIARPEHNQFNINSGNNVLWHSKESFDDILHIDEDDKQENEQKTQDNDVTLDF